MDKIQDWLKLGEGDTAFPLQTEEEIAAVISFFPYFHQHCLYYYIFQLFAF
jgi:hypothetical protein